MRLHWIKKIYIRNVRQFRTSTLLHTMNNMAHPAYDEKKSNNTSAALGIYSEKEIREYYWLHIITYTYQPLTKL